MISSSYDIYFDKMDTYLDLRDLSLNTRKIYHSNLRSYFRWLSETLAVSPDDATFEHIRSYLLHLKHNRKLTNHSINSHSSTIRFFRLFILKQTWNEYDVPRMKYNTPLPFVLSKNDTMAFINSIPNLKHKAFIVLLYSAGLRLSEVATLRWEDIQRKDQRIFIRASKNRKERYALLSSSAITILEIYWRTHGKPMKWLFPGRNPDSPISKSTGANYINAIWSFLDGLLLFLLIPSDTALPLISMSRAKIFFPSRNILVTVPSTAQPSTSSWRERFHPNPSVPSM